LIARKQFVQRVNGRNRLAVEFEHNITVSQAGAGRGTVRGDGYDQYARWRRQLVKAHYAAMQRNVLSAHADIAAPDFAVLDQPAGDVLGGADADREAEALRRKNHGRVHADDFTPRIDQRAAGIAWI